MTTRQVDIEADAEADLDAIADYLIAQKEFATALALPALIRVELGSLAHLSNRCRPGRVEGTREFLLPGTPYIAVYCSSIHTVHVLRILHGRQQWPP